MSQRTMHVARRKRHGRIVFIAILGLTTISSLAQAGEPVVAMVDALCDRGYFDTAVDYLAVIKTQSFVSEEAKQSAGYLKAVVLMKQASATNDLGVREKLFAEAAQVLKSFLASTPPKTFLASANGRLATLEVDLARTRVAAAQAAGKASQDTMLSEARDQFEHARKQLASAEKAFQSTLEEMPKFFAPEEEHLKQRRLELSAELAELQLTSASIDYELAKTYLAGSPHAKKHLRLAAQKFGQLYEDYRTRGAGLYAHLWEGKCYQELGERKRALTAFQDLIDLPETAPEIKTVKGKALRHALEVWTLPEEKKYEAAIAHGDQWVSTSGRAAADDAETTAIKVFTAIAYQKQISTLGPKDPERKRLQQSALKLARSAARQPGEFKEQAIELVAALGGSKEGDPSQEPANFSAAFERGKEALENMQSTRLGREVAIQTNDKQELARIEALEKDSKADAARYFKLALVLDPSGAKVEDINSARYYAAFFEYDAGNYHNAAVIGEFLARKFPQTAEARQGARIALASWVKIYSDSDPQQREFEASRIQDIANYIAKTWPDQIEAAEATATLLNFAVQESNIEKVLEYLERIPADSPQRADSELRAGQALWANYLKAARLPENERPSEEDLGKTKKQAAEILEKGATRLKESQQPSPTLVAGIVSLGQILIDSGSPEKAIAWIEDEKVGPLRLLNEGHTAVYSNDRMPIEIYKLALRAYVAVEPQRLDDAEQIMNSLEKAVSELGDAKASETLTLIYIALGRELQQQLEELRAGKQKQQLKAVSEGFEKFLARIAKREKGNTWNSLGWVAETFASLGAGFEEGVNTSLSPQAKRYYEQAIDAYQQLIARAEQDNSFAPSPEAVLGARLRMSKCMRKIGKYDDAIATIVKVLKERPMMLPAQVMGAETYQAKGIVDQEAYALAILGGKDRDKKGQPVVWGWSKISKLTMNNDKFVEIFHQSRLELSRCRYQFGLLNTDKTKRNKTIDAARQDLWITYKLYPQLGGEELTAEYNRLLIQIQRALGEKPVGLEEFRRRSSETEKSASASTTTS